MSNAEPEHVYPRDKMVLPYPLPVVDAILFDTIYLISQADSSARFRRVPLTSGSIRYDLIAPVPDGAVQFSTIVLRMVSLDHTYIGVEPRADLADLPEEYIERFREYNIQLLHSLVGNIRADQEVMQNLALETKPVPLDETLETLTAVTHSLVEEVKALGAPTRKTPGRKAADYNEEARNRIAAGEDRETVLTDYAKHHGVEPSDAQIRDRFRKAIERTKRTK